MSEQVNELWIVEKDGKVQSLAWCIGMGALTFCSPQEAIAWINKTPGLQKAKHVRFIRDRRIEQ